MPLPRFLLSSPKILAAKTAISMILRSGWMTVGVACEIFALIGAAWNWVDSYQWLPNAALTLATVGAGIVASRVAWDYHGRGLNEKQKGEAKDILTNASLNETQTDEITEAIKSSGLTTRQKSDLLPALQEIDLVSTVFAQKALADAINYLQDAEHGHVAVIRITGFGQLDVQCVAPPPARGKCQRQHTYEQGSDINYLEIAESIFNPFCHPAVLWMQPSSRNLRNTNQNDPGSRSRELVFSFEDCVPKWLVPAGGDYVLTRDDTGRSTWEQKPYEQP